ncbi:restriction endonuclease subunit S [Clostridium tertium]|uniref:Restriction endonuclease subunit S n=2 Tax=Clostridium TaxID=1485 RepID=A0A9X4B2Q8_9CLOT|nr:restriction endonuclease subunit S [Clostridium tertium]MDC4240921.1 restriction endonuclease subunit S [Clostridium tertium]
MKVKLSDVCDIIKGKTTITKAIEGEYPLVVTGENRLSNNEFQFDCSAVCVPLVSATGHGHASIKRIHYQEGKFALGSILAAVIPKSINELNPRYLHIYLSYFKDSVLVPLMRGSANVSLTIKSLGSAEIELPSIDKQLEIVRVISKIEKMKGEIDKYLINQENIISNMKKEILQLAVQGKLVPQDPNDEPASVLLERIKEEKERLIKEKKIKKEKPLAEISEEEKPFELPGRWEWVRLKEIGYNLGQKKPDIKFTYIDVGSINKEKGEIGEELTIIEPENAPSRARKLVDKGTVIYSTVRPYLLNIAIVDKEFEFEPIVSTAFAIIHPYEGINSKYILYYLRSIHFIKYVESKMVGMAYPAINDEKFYSGLFPMPPLAEQKRIVEKVDSLMKLCDDLESKIEKQKNYSNRLMESIIKSSLAK